LHAPSYSCLLLNYLDSFVLFLCLFQVKILLIFYFLKFLGVFSNDSSELIRVSFHSLSPFEDLVLKIAFLYQNLLFLSIFSLFKFDFLLLIAYTFINDQIFESFKILIEEFLKCNFDNFMTLN
jgi:hypothetical protein